MTNLTPNKESKSRWQAADDEFRLQIDRLMAEMRTKSKTTLAVAAGIRPGTMYEYYRSPRLIRMGDLRLLMILFEKHGIKLEATQVIGGAV